MHLPIEEYFDEKAYHPRSFHRHHRFAERSQCARPGS
jgi:hypothetical protein